MQVNPGALHNHPGKKATGERRSSDKPPRALAPCKNAPKRQWEPYECQNNSHGRDEQGLAHTLPEPGIVGPNRRPRVERRSRSRVEDRHKDPRRAGKSCNRGYAEQRRDLGQLTRVVGFLAHRRRSYSNPSFSIVAFSSAFCGAPISHMGRRSSPSQRPFSAIAVLMGMGLVESLRKAEKSGLNFA